MASPSKGLILIIDDEEPIAKFVATELHLEGFDVLTALDGPRGLLAARQSAPDLILLDWMLPGMDGLEICRRLRQTSDVPIIMLTAKGELPYRVAGLNGGANDFLLKPFSFEELLARINVQLRLRRPPARTLYEIADLQLDADAHEVKRNGRRIELTPKEFELLKYLLQHVRQVKTRDQIMAAVWGYEYDGEDNVVDVFIRQLRLKLEREGASKLLQTVRGVGYVLREN